MHSLSRGKRASGGTGLSGWTVLMVVELQDHRVLLCKLSIFYFPLRFSLSLYLSLSMLTFVLLLSLSINANFCASSLSLSLSLRVGDHLSQSSAGQQEASSCILLFLRRLPLEEQRLEVKQSSF